ncbi:pantoate--beta-alanine ligase [Komagataeibacter intermedius]|uniref:Pantothenate synthetase n=2 Tax=Komagataeibacter intermedius TaxID=66229 RepID=A0A0N1N587_9PROT|nr:pantoate--beta-alanine ligase [Komagataeibacter intermedius]KPH88315.1 pantoate--beta-alanine ligase [Komagataeibacter intermedius AF2]MCF3635656.1 pantoate--beta-alanine ligase [Komagataeibacter intermedius]GAN87725.1 pantoate--beta-alanine ligase [Komagataeibacter intermedius TF2]GBQ75591.1 pantoate--beta-alanine ligase [Komagataeibacter intermedius NRIC 0521]
METISTVAGLRARVRQWKQAGARVGVVPTMGALHDGHLSLVHAARAQADRVITTVFVNPIQFDNADDLATYPRTLEDDARLLAAAGVDMLYAPTVSQMYPPGFATRISVSGVSEGLCGGARPGHFDGVATVVCKLLMQTLADCAFFGEKDFQQVQVVRRMVTDLDLPVEIVTCPTQREADGLALSSRNRRLAPHQRQIAVALPRILRVCAADIAAGADVPAALAQAVVQLADAGFDPVDYVELRSELDLQPLAVVSRGTPARLLAAAWLGDVRLIDGMAVPLPE